MFEGGVFSDQSDFPFLDPTLFLSMIRKGLRKGSDPRDLELFGFTPEQV